MSQKPIGGSQSAPGGQPQVPFVSVHGLQTSPHFRPAHGLFGIGQPTGGGSVHMPVMGSQTPDEHVVLPSGHVVHEPGQVTPAQGSVPQRPSFATTHWSWKH